MVVFNKISNFDIVSVFSTICVAYLLTDFIELRKKIDTEADLLNNTRRSNQSFLIFNRTPKAGSETVWGMMDFLQHFNNFTSASDSAKVKKERGSENTWLNYEDRKTYALMLYNDTGVTNLTVPFSYVKHLNFLNFEEFNITNPIWVNMVRHPVERVVSWFYYTRQAWYLLEHDQDRNTTHLHKRAVWPRHYKFSYDECVLEQMPECTYPIGTGIHSGNVNYGGSHFSQIAFFCGMEPACNVFGSTEALEIAKHNVERYYAVVGVLEKWKETMEVLEAYVPAYYKGAKEVYKNYFKDQPKNKNFFKVKASQSVKDLVRANFTTEIEFYNFCRQRLYRQYLTL